MVQFNFSERTIKAKVVYYGPPQSGKTTNLEQIHRLTDPDGSNRLISLNTAQDRTLFFDLLPFSLGAVSGYDFKIQLYTVPGQVQYNATRRVVLAGADAVVFVADSQRLGQKDNMSAFENMKVNLLANRLVPEKVPLVLQYNKQDLHELQPRAEMDRTLNFWQRKAFPAVAARGEGVMETFVAVVQEMLAAIAVKYNLKEKGLDPAVIPEVVGQAFSALLKKVPPPPPGIPAGGSPARVILAQTPDSEPIYPLQTGPDASPVSEELLHRAIRSNVELAEALSDLVKDVNVGLGSILSHADLLLSYREEAKRTAAIGEIQREAARLRRRMQELGRVAATQGGRAPAAAPGAFAAGSPVGSPPASVPRPPPASVPRPAPASVPRPAPTPVARPAAHIPGPVPVPPGAGLDAILSESALAARAALEARRVAVDSRIAAGTPPPRCPPANVRRALVALFNGLAAACPVGASIGVRSERKPVLLRSKEGEVKRDFLMLALTHPAGLRPEDQQRVLQGGDPGPLGESYRLVREMGGFIRFAPLPGETMETRVFLPAV
jgi:signal recognition particle receptor subunit beta